MSDKMIVKNDGEEIEVSLADIANIDMNEVEAFEGGFEPTPKGVYQFLVKDAGLDTINDKAVIFFELEVEQVLALADDDKDPESLVGWKHKETIFVGDLAKSVGQAKAIMQNAGYVAQGNLETLLDGFCGMSFIAPIGWRKDKNDTDRVYSNIKVGKITPVPMGESDVQEEPVHAAGLKVG